MTEPKKPKKSDAKRGDIRWDNRGAMIVRAVVDGYIVIQRCWGGPLCFAKDVWKRCSLTPTKMPEGMDVHHGDWNPDNLPKLVD